MTNSCKGLLWTLYLDCRLSESAHFVEVSQKRSVKKFQEILQKYIFWQPTQNNYIYYKSFTKDWEMLISIWWRIFYKTLYITVSTFIWKGACDISCFPKETFNCFSSRNRDNSFTRTSRFFPVSRTWLRQFRRQLSRVTFSY